MDAIYKYLVEKCIEINNNNNCNLNSEVNIINNNEITNDSIDGPVNKKNKNKNINNKKIKSGKIKKRSNFFIPTTKEKLQKLIEICKEQIKNYKTQEDFNNDLCKPYYKQLCMNRYIRSPPKNFLIPYLSTIESVNTINDLNNTYKINELIDLDGIDEIDGNYITTKSDLNLDEKRVEILKLNKILNDNIRIRNRNNIIDHIKSTNSKFWYAFNNNLNNLNFKYRSIFVDGTCCVGKSTMLQLLTQHNITHCKSNKEIYCNNINTHPSYSIGYSFKTLELIESTENVVWDRSPHNNILWFKMWYMLACNKDVETLTPEHYNMMRTVLESDMSNVLENMFLTCAPNIIIINSDEAYGKTKLYERNTNSDRARSIMNHYLTTQNYSYSWLSNKYPDKIILIDIAQYINKHEDGLSLMQEAIVEIIKEILPKLKHTKTFSNEKLNKHKLSYFSDKFHVENKINPLMYTFHQNMQKQYVESIKQHYAKHGPKKCTIENITKYCNERILNNIPLIDVVEKDVTTKRYINGNTNGDIIENLNDGILDLDFVNSIDL